MRILNIAGLEIGLQDSQGHPLHLGDTVRVQYWHGFTFTGVLRYHPRYAAFGIEDDLIANMDLDRGTTLTCVATTASYTANDSWLAQGNACCVSCGQLPENHHSDQRCYTPDELLQRLRFSQETGHWPGPDEGCTP